MAISLLAFVAPFSGQLYFWRNYFFALLQSNSFDTTVTFSEQLFLQNRYVFWGASIFRTVTSLQQSFLQNSNFFRAKLARSSHFLRISNSLQEALFATPTFLVEKLFRIKTFSEEVLSRTRSSCAASTFSEVTFSEKAIFWKSIFPHCLHFLDSYYFRRCCFRTPSFSQLHSLFIYYLFIISPILVSRP